MKKNIILLSILSATVLIQSCKKDKEEDHEHAEVNITITYPTYSTHLHLNDTLDIEADITSNIEIHGYEATLKNVTADTIVWSTSEHEHMTNYHIHGSWINDVTDTSDMQLTIIAEVDHDGTTESKTVSFICLPQ